ncbi:MAG: aquaporin family protein [Actinobacteria bacterium]|nr:aquaporin family protein [Thermoleophilia bacterium]MCB9011974.1 aquaporin family protein [Actinomycetota bacterium]
MSTETILIGEIVGTALLILLGDGVVAAVVLAKSKAQDSGWIVITFGWGMAVAMAVYAVGHYSGAHLNPAVTLGLWANSGDGGADIWKYVLGQFIGAMIGAILVFLSYLPHWQPTQDPGTKLAVFSTGPAIRNPVANLITEIVGTFVLVFGVLAIGDHFSEGVVGNTELASAFSVGIAPLLVGFLVFSIGLSLGGPTGYAINPARDLGPRIIHALLPIPGKGGSDWSYAWIPVVGPIIGGILGGLVFKGLYPIGG